MAVQDLREARALRRAEPPEAHPERNPGMPLDLAWVRDVRVNTSAVERRAATLPKRRTVKKDWQAAWYLRAITCIGVSGSQAARRKLGAPAASQSCSAFIAALSALCSAFASG